MPRGYPMGFSWRLFYSDLSLVYPISPTAPRREAWCGLQRDLQPAATHRRPVCRPDIPPLCRCRRRRLLLLRMEKRNDKNTWRCPGQSADSPAGYWLRAPVCHCWPSKAEHHLLRACCDENKDRRGRRGMGRRGDVWVGRWGVVVGCMALLLKKKKKENSPLCILSTQTLRIMNELCVTKRSQTRLLTCLHICLIPYSFLNISVLFIF